MSDALERTVRLRISVAALRSVEHRGGLDAFLVKASEDELSPRARLLRKEVLAKRAENAARRQPKPPDRLACHAAGRIGIVVAVAAMAAVVVLSNVLVQHPFACHTRPAEPRRPPDLGRLQLSARLPGDRHHQPAARARGSRAASSISASPSRSCCRSGSRRRASPSPPARHSSPASCSTSASSTGCGNAPGGRRRPSPASPARLSTR